MAFQRYVRNRDYSKNELKLFKLLDLDYLVGNLASHEIFRIAAEQCFLTKRNDDVAAAVRNGLKAINDHTPYRMTEEFEKLIEVFGHD